jgi:DNA-binding response OmpR family regulator
MPGGAKHIILIDDDVVLARLLRKELERHRYKVSIAASGAAGSRASRKAVSTSSFSIIICPSCI